MTNKYIMILWFAMMLVLPYGLKADDGYKVNDIAEDFKLKNVDGKTISMRDFPNAKGFIVIFTCNHCPYSKLYEDRIIALNNEYATKGYPVIAINPNDPIKQPEDSFEEMKARAKAKKYSFPYLVDESQAVAKRFGAKKTPHVYILSKQKNGYRVEYIGAIDNNHKDAKNADKHYVNQAVNQLLSGKSISQTSTKAIGCSIKWK